MFLVSYPKNQQGIQCHKAFPLCFCLRQNIIVLALMFRSLIHFELIFVHGVRQGSRFILLLVNMQFSQCHLSRKLSFYTLNGLDTLVENHLSIYGRVYLWALYTIPLVYAFVFMPVRHCFYYCS